MNRHVLHDLIERIPESEMLAAQRFLEYLVASPALRAARLAHPDDEPVTNADAESIERAKADVASGRVSSHEAVLSEFGLL